MKTIHGHDRLPPLKWPVATLGTFDGVHLGHQKVLREVVSWAHHHNGEAVVITFSTHPRSITAGKASGFIASLQHRLILMERLGVGVVLVLDFDRKLASMPAEEFVREYFCRQINARGIVMGFDNRFGKGGRGNTALLKQMGPARGFEVHEVGPVHVDGELVSSTAIRGAISEGRFERAAAMLGRPVSLLATVVGGEGRGRQLGFPTANLDLHHETRPPHGLYAGRTTIAGHTYRVLLSIGNQPTFHAPGSPVVVEAYLHGYEGELYGQYLEIIFIKKLREQRQFESAEELVAAMRHDVEQLEKIPIE
jgi:riboflavin kinase/FMN adenylyltransferase